MIKPIAGLWMIMAMLLTMPACGGGGGGVTPAPAQPTTAVIKITVQGTPSASPINGIQATLHLPAGVSVKATLNAPQTDAGVVTASGNAAGADLVLGIYPAASGTVNIYVTKTNGFIAGEFATVNCDIAPGTLPAASDFNLTGLDVRDSNGAVVSGLTPVLNVALL